MAAWELCLGGLVRTCVRVSTQMTFRGERYAGIVLSRVILTYSGLVGVIEPLLSRVRAVA